MKTVSEFYRLAGGLVRGDSEREELRSVLAPAVARALPVYRLGLGLDQGHSAGVIYQFSPSPAS